MKRIFQILGVLLLLGIVFLSISGRNMQIVKAEIEIQAPPEKVWGILTDIDKWHEWSPIINESAGQAAVGSTVTITMMSKEAGKNGPKYSPTIIEMDEPRLFHWRAKMMAEFLFTNDKIIELEKTDEGTRVIHKETFKGLMAALMKGQMEKGVPPMLNMMNDALKQLAEK
ncbi:MAG: SRPBCC domain-containing protein [Granulosicoccus sp.]|nr:SRPBCC domain-containing protein [Granulosicoccus sp.]